MAAQNPLFCQTKRLSFEAFLLRAAAHQQSHKKIRATK
jgi:hypothetical protein